MKKKNEAWQKKESYMENSSKVGGTGFMFLESKDMLTVVEADELSGHRTNENVKQVASSI